MLAYLAAMKSSEKSEMKTLDNQNDFGQAVGDDLPNWTAAQFPPDTTLEGRYCRIERLNPSKHAVELFEAFSVDREGRNWTYLAYGPFSEYSEFLLHINGLAKGNDPLAFVIIDTESGKAVGVATYIRISPEIGSIEVGHIHFSPLLQRKPGGTEAMYLMMKNVFETLGYRRYEWKCHSLNTVSRKAAVRLGFSYEGTFRQATVMKGKNRDTSWFSIIDSEWPVLKAAFEKWLAPDNFKENGDRITSLPELIARQETKVF
ncbi:GNAT family protein [Pseudovibrio sp. Tun.PSC04-5.I4]|uniref:GNAT family N-acetyltransferase n=1 Tax=Pseudovibrio sp. Tun.PSC04-5.I4 TaxID=1798213 RepID=UPI000891F12D|nr:GNAT family protein [Pseudovibrio sp. Tun.PSC04-5.I4]SDR24347.1 Protein N-acetyltransferase, RimJ/RimL family [Pseudovibrio sp. Tun.PSC04-5.I4]